MGTGKDPEVHAGVTGAFIERAYTAQTVGESAMHPLAVGREKSPASAR